MVDCSVQHRRLLLCTKLRPCCKCQSTARPLTIPSSRRPRPSPLQALAARDAALEKKEGVAAALQAELLGRDAQLAAAAEEAATLRGQVRWQGCWVQLVG